MCDWCFQMIFPVFTEIADTSSFPVVTYSTPFQ